MSNSPGMVKHYFHYHGLFHGLPVLMYLYSMCSTVSMYIHIWGLCRGVIFCRTIQDRNTAPREHFGVCATLGVMGRCTELVSARFS